MVVLDELQGLAGAKSFIHGLFRRDFGLHAILLYGAQGSGKTTLAQAVSTYWTCTAPSESGPCGKCQSCVAMDRGSHSDVMVFEPVGRGRIIPVSAIKEPKQRKDSDPPIPLATFVRTGPLMGRNKVAIFEDCDRMTSDAANAILKILEEPPSNTKLILTTSLISRILSTVLSRCHAIACELPPSLESDAPVELVQLAEGSPGQLHIICGASEIYVRLADFARNLGAKRKAHALTLSDDFRDICGDLEKHLKTNARQAQAEALRLLAQELARSKQFDSESVQAAIEAHRRILGNANASFVFDALFTSLLPAKTGAISQR